MRTVTVLRFLPPGGAVRAFEWSDDAGLVRLDPRWLQAAVRFVELGFLHILDGTDHLLFILCLVIPFRRLRPLILLVTSFTVAHSITLIASAFGLAPNALWFPPLIETLIAISIIYMALENIVGSNVQRRWMITFAFGWVLLYSGRLQLAGPKSFRKISGLLPPHSAFHFAADLSGTLAVGVGLLLVRLGVRWGERWIGPPHVV